MSPPYAGMYGGEVLEVSAQCLTTNSVPVCRFGNKVSRVTSQGYAINGMKFKCVVPRLSERGYLDIEASIDSGRRYNHKGKIFIGML